MHWMGVCSFHSFKVQFRSRLDCPLLSEGGTMIRPQLYVSHEGHRLIYTLLLRNSLTRKPLVCNILVWGAEWDLAAFWIAHWGNIPRLNQHFLCTVQLIGLLPCQRCSVLFRTSSSIPRHNLCLTELAILRLRKTKGVAYHAIYGKLNFAAWVWVPRPPYH